MRKTIKFLGLAAGAASILASCQKEELVDTGAVSEMVEYSIVASAGPETKTTMTVTPGEEGDTYSITWNEKGETLAVFEDAMFNGESISITHRESTEGVGGGKSMTFGVSFPKNTLSDKFKYYSVYPAKAVAANAQPVKEIKTDDNGKTTERFFCTINLSNVQKPTEGSFATDADILISKPITKGKEDQLKEETSLAFQFGRIISIGRMQVKGLEKVKNSDGHGGEIEAELLEGETIRKITINAGTSRISGGTKFDFNSGSAEINESNGRKRYGTLTDLTLDYSDEEIEANGMTAYFTVWPSEIKAGQTLTITVETENYIFTKSFELGKNLNFYEGKVTKFNANFTGEFGVEKEPAPIADGAVYTIGRSDTLMVSSLNQNGLASSIVDLGNDANVSINEENLPAAWKFLYDSKKHTYRICSVSDPAKYIMGCSPQESSLRLASEAEATNFTVNKVYDNDTDKNVVAYKISYKLSNGAVKYIGYQKKGETPIYFMLGANTKSDLALREAVVLPAIRVNENFEIQGEVSEGSEENVNLPIPVSYFNIDEKTVVAEVSGADWLTVGFKDANKTEIVCSANPNNAGIGPRTASFTVSGTGKDGKTVVTKTITVTQLNAGIFYASLDVVAESRLKELRAAGTFKDNDPEFTYSQPNGAVWTINCTSNNNVDYLQLGAIGLPTFNNAIRKVTVTTFDVPVKGRILTITGNGGDVVTRESVGDKTFVFDFTDSKNINKSATLTANGVIKVKSIEVETREPLAIASEGLATEGKTLSWPEVADAAAYDVTVGSTTVKDVKGTSYTFDIVDEWYDVSVTAIADEYSKLHIDSEPAEANLKFGNPMLQAPVLKEGIVTSETVNVTWEAVANATEGYFCTLYINGTEVKSADTKETQITFAGLTPGKEYTVTVKAVETDRYKESALSGAIAIKTLEKELTGDGSKDKPYTADDVIYLTEKGISLAGKYIAGTVAGTPSWNSSDKTMSYTITDGQKNFAVTNGKDLGNVVFASSDLLKSGNPVVIFYENDNDNYLYSINGKTLILTGIKVAKNQKTDFYYGERNFVKPAAVATYRGKADEDVTESEYYTAEYGEPNVNGGAHTVTLAYTEDGETVYTSFAITVKAKGLRTYTHLYTPANMSEDITNQNNIDPWSNTSDGITTYLIRFNNFGRTKDFVRNAGNKIDGQIYTTEAIPEKITKVILDIYSTNTTGSTITLVITDSEGNSTSIDKGVMAKGLVTFEIPNAKENCNYKLLFTSPVNVKIDLSKITFTNEQ